MYNSVSFPPSNFFKYLTRRTPDRTALMKYNFIITDICLKKHGYALKEITVKVIIIKG